MLDAPSPALSAVRARTVFVLLVASLILPFVVLEFVWPDWAAEDKAPLVDPLIELAGYLLWAILLWLVSVRAGVHSIFHLGELPIRAELYRYAALSLPLILVSVAGIYVVYLPLSYIFPGFVTEWLLTVPPSLDWDEPQANAIAIGGSIISLCVIAPVTEEVAFRGFLLNRWWKKYGLRKAIASSSICFGILHADIVGAFIFGMILSLLFVKTSSLWGPIIIHISNNFFGLIIFCMMWYFYGEIEDSSLDEFRSFWWVGALGLIIGTPWLFSFRNRYLRG